MQRDTLAWLHGSPNTLWRFTTFIQEFVHGQRAKARPFICGEQSGSSNAVGAYLKSSIVEGQATLLALRHGQT